MSAVIDTHKLITGRQLNLPNMVWCRPPRVLLKKLFGLKLIKGRNGATSGRSTTSPLKFPRACRCSRVRTLYGTYRLSGHLNLGQWPPLAWSRRTRQLVRLPKTRPIRLVLSSLKFVQVARQSLEKVNKLVRARLTGRVRRLRVRWNDRGTRAWVVLALRGWTYLLGPITTARRVVKSRSRLL